MQNQNRVSQSIPSAGDKALLPIFPAAIAMNAQGVRNDLSCCNGYECTGGTPWWVGCQSAVAPNTTPTPTTTTVPLSTVTPGPPVTGHARCRPQGLYKTEELDIPYCTKYDEQGREKMGLNHSRRVIGYFIFWRTGAGGTPTYLVNQIPWDKITHVQYAFAHVGSDHKISVGDVFNPNNVATRLTWTGVDIDPALEFRGHFGALATYKQRYNVSTLIFVGGWAESGGHLLPNDNELEHWEIYTEDLYKRIGYPNTNWAYHYFRGAISAGRINIGIPYYSRGWKGVAGGQNGLWGNAALANQGTRAPGTGMFPNNKCGNGASGVNNLWHDKRSNGLELASGSNPMWHAKNLENGIYGSYLPAYGFPAYGILPGNYNCYHLNPDNTRGEVDLTENSCHQGTGAAPYGNNVTPEGSSMLTAVLDVEISLGCFKIGDKNYPLNPILTIKNNGNLVVPGGLEIHFTYGTSAPDNM
eukprot:Ihof_evm8s8 gene=Ihof_evmTU8s8